MGLSEHIAATVTVYPHLGDPLIFGLTVLGSESVGRSLPHTPASSDLISVVWGRQIGQADHGAAGRMAFMLPGRTEGSTGRRFSELMSPNDPVLLQVTCQRSGDRDLSAFSQGWAGRFLGFVHEIEASELEEAGGFTETSTVICMDSMGTLDFEKFSYWRNLGTAFKGTGLDPDFGDKIARFERAGFNQGDISMNSIAGAAEVIFESLLYARLAFKRKLGGKTVGWDEMHAYRFESDEFGVNIALEYLAPEGSSWMDALSWAVDAPHFYEIWLDNLDLSEWDKKLRNGGVNDVGASNVVRKKETGLGLPGSRVETFVIRPCPFPSYDPLKGGYRSAAWDNLKTLESLPFGHFSENFKRSRESVFTLFSTRLTHDGGIAGGNSADRGDSEAQFIFDAEKFQNMMGYRPLDAESKRFTSRVTLQNGKNVQVESLSTSELMRRLNWQLFSFNHYNDLFHSGPLSTPLDLRAELGVRWLHDGWLYYLEGYTHKIDTKGASSDLTLTRGLPLEVYGTATLKGAHFSEGNLLGRGGQVERNKNAFPETLGRKRPGETLAPTNSNGMSEQFKTVRGEHGK